jgi:hypothetical protein
MASAAIHIPNMLEAVRNGTVPGAFSEDRTEFAFPTLAYAGSRGATHLWTIRVRLLGGGDEGDEYVEIGDEMLDQPAPDLPGLKAEITVVSQQLGGKIRDTVPTYVSTGKNLGKKNATNPLTQAFRDALGLYNKQKKRADIMEAPVEEPAESAAPKTRSSRAKPPPAPRPSDVETLDTGDEPRLHRAPAEFDPMPPPMLVKKLGDSRDATLTPDVFARGITVQPKLNGVHYVVFARSGPGGKKTLIRYSRTGTEYPGQEQVVSEMLPMIAQAPRLHPGEYGLPASPENQKDRRVLAAYGALPDEPGDPAPYFAGELYLHGKSLNWISGQARRGDDEGILEFHVFDVFFPYAKAAGHDMASRDRQAYIDSFFATADAAGLAHPHVRRVPNVLVADASAPGGRRQVRDMADLNTLAKGFLAEVKPVHDAEYKVVGYTQGTRGKDVGAVIWECEVPEPVNPRDKTFTVVPKDLVYEDRYAIFACLGRAVPGADGRPTTRFERDIKGLPLTVEYREISPKTGKPLQAKALAFRTYEAGPENDPVRKLLAECRAEADA